TGEPHPQAKVLERTRLGLHRRQRRVHGGHDSPVYLRLLVRSSYVHLDAVVPHRGEREHAGVKASAGVDLDDPGAVNSRLPRVHRLRGSWVEQCRAPGMLPEGTPVDVAEKPEVDWRGAQRGETHGRVATVRLVQVRVEETDHRDPVARPSGVRLQWVVQEYR